MISRYFRAVFLVAGMFSLPLFLPAVASAQGSPTDSGVIVVRPAKIELTLRPGEEKDVVISVSNGTISPVSAQLSFEDIDALPQRDPSDDPVGLLGERAGTRSLKDILTASRRYFDLLSGKETEVRVTVSAPKDAEPGGRYGSAVFTFRPRDNGDRNVFVETRIATLLFVRIEGAVVEEGKLSAFGVFNNERYIPAPSKTHPLKFHLSFENTGSVHLNPYGRILVSPIVGDDRTIVVDPGAVLPGATRMREFTIEEELSPGYWRATLELNRGYGDIVDEAAVWFVVLPTPEGGFMIVVLLVIIGWVLRKSLRLSRNFVR